MRLLIAAILCLLMVPAMAQDPATSQPYGAPLYLNPAFAGYEGCSRVALSYRNQWPGLSGSSQTVLASYDQYVHPMRGGIGVNFMYDNAGGTLGTWAASVIYSPTFGLFKRKLLISPAIEIGYLARTLEWSKLTFGNMIDPRYGFVYPTQDTVTGNSVKHMFDGSVGLLIAHHGFRYGVAVRHFTQPDEGFGGESRLPFLLNAHIAYTAKLAERFRLMGSFMYSRQQDFEMFVPNIAFNFYGMRVGSGFRASLKNFDSVIISTGYSRKWFSVGYSYDITVSSLGNSTTGGSHEVNLQFRFNCSNKEVGRKGDSMWGM